MDKSISKDISREPLSRGMSATRTASVSLNSVHRSLQSSARDKPFYAPNASASLVGTVKPAKAAKNDIATVKAKEPPGCCHCHCTMPLWLLFLLQIAFTLALFLAIINFLTVREFDARKFSIEEKIASDLNLLGNKFYSPVRSHEDLLMGLGVRFQQRPDIYKCRDGSNLLQTNVNFMLLAYALQYNDPYMAYMYQMTLMPGGEPLECLASTALTRVCNRGVCHVYELDGNYTSSTTMNNFKLKKLVSENLLDNDYTIAAHSTTKPQWVPTIFYNEETKEFFLLFNFLLSLVPHLTPEQALSTKQQWTIGLDLDMSMMHSLAREATSAIEAGAHTSMYVIGRGLIATSLKREEMEHFKIDGTNYELWPAGKTPHEGLNRAYRRAYAYCPNLCPQPEVRADEDYILAYSTTVSEATGMRILMVQEIPEAYYFGSVREARGLMIGIGVAAALLLAAVCVLILLAIRSPVRKLEANFELAATMQNDKVMATHAMLSEINSLSRAFDRMNAKLLVARAFMPQSYLDENNEDCDDEGSLAGEGAPGSSFIGSSAVGSSARRKTSASGATNQTSSTEQEARIAARMALTQRKVSVLAVNVLGFHRLAADGASVLSITEQLTGTVQTVTAANGGIVDAFHGDHYMLTFNGTRVISLGGKRMALCALELRSAVANTLGADVMLSMGGAQGTASVGSLGTTTLRRFSVVGPVYATAVALEKGSKRLQQREGERWGVTFGWCLLNPAATTEADTAVVHQIVGRMRVRGQIVPIHSIVAPVPEQADEEWLYQVGNADDDNPMKVHNNAFLALIEGDTEHASRLFSEHQQSPSADVVKSIPEANSVAPPFINDPPAPMLELSQDAVRTAAAAAWQRLECLLPQLPPYAPAPFPESEMICADIDP